MTNDSSQMTATKYARRARAAQAAGKPARPVMDKLHAVADKAEDVVADFMKRLRR